MSHMLSTILDSNGILKEDRRTFIVAAFCLIICPIQALVGLHA